MTGVSLVHGLEDPICGLGPVLDAARLAQPGLESCGALSLGGATSLDEAGLVWRDALFVETLAPFLLDQLAFGRAGMLREMLESDAAFTTRLDPVLAERSERAGRKLAALAGAMRGDRLLPRIAMRSTAGDIPCHYLTVFAARCAAFSIDDRTAIGAYVIREVAGWNISSTAPAVAGFIRSCIQVIPSARFGLRAA